MHGCCEAHANAMVVERWITDGFWYLSGFV